MTPPDTTYGAPVPAGSRLLLCLLWRWLRAPDRSDPFVFPAVETLSRMLGQTSRATRKQLEHLRGAGLIVEQVRPHEGGLRRGWVLTPEPQDRPAEPSDLRPPSSDGNTGPPDGSHSSRPHRSAPEPPDRPTGARVPQGGPAGPQKGKEELEKRKGKQEATDPTSPLPLFQNQTPYLPDRDAVAEAKPDSGRPKQRQLEEQLTSEILATRRGEIVDRFPELDDLPYRVRRKVENAVRKRGLLDFRDVDRWVMELIERDAAELRKPTTVVRRPTDPPLQQATADEAVDGFAAVRASVRGTS